MFDQDCDSHARDKTQVEGQCYRASNCSCGFRCANCNKHNGCNSKKINEPRAKAIEKVEKQQKIEKISNRLVVFDEEAVSFIKSQSKIDKTLLTIDGQSIISSACLLNNLFKKQENELKKRQSHSDEFAQEFFDFYEKHPSFQNGLAGQIAQLTISRAKNACAPIPSRLVDFFCLASNKDRKAGEVLSAQFDGPTARRMIVHEKKTAGFAEKKAYCLQRQE